MVGLLAVDPAFDWAKDVTFRHDVWVLRFRFKPMRMMWVDVPQPSGFMQRKLIWYMVYRGDEHRQDDASGTRCEVALRDV